MKAVIYARYSSDMQKEDSIAAQVRECEKFAASNGYTIIEKYLDRALSGKSDERPEFQRMIAEARLNAFDAVLIHKFDRFARNRYDHAVYGKVLKDNGIELIAVGENFGTGKEAILMEGILQSLSEYYVVNLAQEVKKGHREVALKALHNGGYPPFGYDVREQKYYINETEAAFVRRMFAACIDGAGYKEILADLAAAGIVGKRGRPMRYTSVYEILRNEKYTGTYVYVPQTGRRRDKSQAIRIVNALPAIVDQSIWERAQRIMDANKNVGKSGRHEYLLAGVARCTCGASMHGMTTTKDGNSYSRYYCSAKCGAPTVRTDAIDTHVLDYLENLLTEENRQVIQARFGEYLAHVRGQRDEENAQIDAEIKDKDKQIATMIDNMGKSSLPAPVLEDMGKRIEQLKEQIAVLVASKKPEVADYTKKQVLDYLEVVHNVKALSFAEQKALVAKYIKNIVIDGKSAPVESTFADIAGILGRGDRI